MNGADNGSEDNGLISRRLRKEVLPVAQSVLKRYNLSLPPELYEELEALAEKQHTTLLEVIRRSLKLGLLAAKIQDTPGASLIIREGEKERELMLI